MGNSKALVRAGGGDKWELRFSRLPIVGEFVRVDGHIYEVRHVIHNPSPSPDGYVAELTVALS